MAEASVERFDIEAAVFTVSVAASLADMHPQTLRTYDRLGLVVPSRTRGRGRRYSLRDVARLRHVQRLSQDDGVNLEGIRRILALEAELEAAVEHASRLAETVRRLQADPVASRLFTAGASGAVSLGRLRPTTPPALTSQAS